MTNIQCIPLDDGTPIAVTELTRVCGISLEQVRLLVGEGVLQPSGATPEQWSFGGAAIPRIRRMLRLQRDLGLNLAGAALALELLDEIAALRARVQILECQLGLEGE